MLRWLKRIALVVVASVALAAGVCAALIGPFVLDDLALDRTVRAVALDWRDFGEDKAVERLQYELDHQGIGSQVADEDCALVDESDERVVACTWTAEIAVPGADVAIPLGFRSRAHISASGDIF